MALFFPELFLLVSCLVIFLLTLGKMSSSTVRNITAALSVVAFLVCVGSLRLEGDLFFKAYRIDLFSQLFKLLITGGVALLLGLTLAACGGKGDSGSAEDTGTTMTGRPQPPYGVPTTYTTTESDGETNND